ncbi:MAG: Gx transporter family protein [Clostridia bacterium]|nr:Gx transporter family protein [Clostridia bacterium]
MSAKQSDSANRIDTKRLTLYALFTAAALIFSYIESLFPLAFIAPGVKLGLSNAVVLFLAVRKDYKGAFLVSIVRLLLSALLFGSFISFLFSFAGGMFSLLIICLLNKTGLFSAVGVSIAGGVAHNVAQLVVAYFIIKGAVWYYLPVLALSGALCGGLVGAVSLILLKKIKTNYKL